MKYNFSKPDLDLESTYFIADEILKLTPKWLEEVEKVDRSSGVLALAQFLERFAQNWLQADWNEFYHKTDAGTDFAQESRQDQQFWKNWQLLILALQKNIWARCAIFLDFENPESCADSVLQLESMLELYQSFTVSQKLKKVVGSYYVDYFTFAKPSHIFENYLQDQNKLIQTIEKAHILDKPKYICEILNSCKHQQFALNFDQFQIISEIIIDISHIKIDDRWHLWFLKFYRPGRSNDAAILEAQEAWYESLKDLRLDWSLFGKSKFLSESELAQINQSKIPKYRKIETTAKENVNKNGKKITICGQFGVETDMLVLALQLAGFEFVPAPAKECDLILVGFGDYKKRFQAQKYAIKQIYFLDLLQILTTKE